MQHIVKIKSLDKITPDVLKIITEKPKDFSFTPGQATKVSINKSGWENDTRSFTFTSLPDDDYLEFIIKIYPYREKETNELLQLQKEDELILHEVFGSISYRFEGVFIAGGMGITPFISIFRDLARKNKIGNNKLILASKTKDDIILEEEFKKILGKNFIPILSNEIAEGYPHGKITKEFIKANIGEINQTFYICGPQAMVKSIEEQLGNLNVYKDYIIKELF